jgi:uncharacterized protein (TIGR03382 family)
MAISFSKGVIAVAAMAGLATVASAEVLLTIDVSTPNQITINSTTGLSAADRSGATGTGFYLANFFTINQALTSTLVPGGNLTTFNDPSDNSPAIFRGGAADPGLNVWSYSTNSTSSVTAGIQAFSGSATWTVSPAVYASLISANTSGTIYFPADTSDDITAATAIGEYSVVPAPGAAAVLGLGGLLVGRRRR